VTGDPTAEPRPAPAVEEPRGEFVPLTPPSILALVGAAMVALSAVLAWAIQPFFGSGTAQGIYPSSLSLPRLIKGGFAGDQPRLGLVLVVVAIAAVFLLLANPNRRSLDMGRRVLGLIVLALAVLFYVRFAQISGVPDRFEPPGSLRAGFYVGVAGGLLTILTGRSLRSR
jgi:hypothetical protein